MPGLKDYISNRNKKIFLSLLLFILTFASSRYIDNLWEQQEDAFITYTYAHRLASGDGFTFSPGEPPAYGTTSPLYTLILAGIDMMGIPPHISSPWINSISHAISSVLLFLLGSMIATSWIGFIAGLLWSGQWIIFFRSGGMETPLLIVILLFILRFIGNSKPNYILPILMGLLLLLRPDSLILIGILFLYWSFIPEDRKNIIKYTGIIILLYLPWAIYAWYNFGTIIPTSLTAKLINPFQVSGIISLNNYYDLFLPLRSRKLLFLAFIIFILFGSYPIWKNHPRWRPILIWLPVYYIVLRLGGAPNFGWYYIPPMPIAILLLVLGVYYLCQSIPMKFNIILSLLIYFIIFLEFGKANYAIIQPLYTYQGHSLQYLMATYIRDNTGENAVVAAFEVGNLGYYGNRRVLDLLGLVSPQLHPLIKNHQIIDIIEYYKPDYILCDDWADIEKDYKIIQKYGPKRIYKRYPLN